ncbi:unnamed protein product [Onchocerca flexuosa]|uniref:Uncharacterized protein n=1 Tax=Onchocerca flexuosa TaxID=387005 RepID=A0A183HH45_9BILA|nr:unnamed protein product [Onchocerca flexuosa]
MNDHADSRSSAVSTKVIPRKINNEEIFIDYINSIHNGDINVPVKLTKGSMNDIEKRDQIQIVIDQISNEMSHRSIQQSLIQDEMSQIQSQSNEKRVISSRISDYSNQVPIQSDQQSIIRNSEDRNISNAESVNKAQENQFSKTSINSTTFTKKESQSSTRKNTSDSCKKLSTTDYYIFPNSAFVPSLPLSLNSEEQPKLLDKEMFRTSDTSLHTRRDGRKVCTKPSAVSF